MKVTLEITLELDGEKLDKEIMTSAIFQLVKACVFSEELNLGNAWILFVESIKIVEMEEK